MAGLKFIYSEKATKFCKISTLLLSYVVPVKCKVEISQNFEAFSEYMNINRKTFLKLKMLIQDEYFDFGGFKNIGSPILLQTFSSWHLHKCRNLMKFDGKSNYEAILHNLKDIGKFITMIDAPGHNIIDFSKLEHETGQGICDAVWTKAIVGTESRDTILVLQSGI